MRGPNKTALFVPDIDRWDVWDRDIESVVESVDIAILDATFYSAAEVGGRSQEQIPHPLVTDTMRRLGHAARSGRTVALTHLNNSNPVLDEGSPERAAVLEAGFTVARAGQRYAL